MTDEMVLWLREQVDEDERAAQKMAEHYPSPWDVADRGWMATVKADEPHFRTVVELEQWPGQPPGTWLGGVIEHVARHDPARVLAEVAAKRRIIERHAPAPGFGCLQCSVCSDGPGGFGDSLWQAFPCETIQAVASVYAGRPGWREEWAADEEVSRP